MVERRFKWLAVFFVLLLAVIASSCVKSRTVPDSSEFIYSGPQTQSGLLSESASETASSGKESSESRENSMGSEISKHPETSKPAEPGKPSESSAQPNTSAPSESSKPSESSRPSESSQPSENSKPPESEPEPQPALPEYLKGIWVSQYDMSSVYLNGSAQRSKSSYTAMVEKIIANIKQDGFNTIFLQMRPFGDSFYNSEYYPLSRFVAGSYGGSIGYDPIEIFIEKARAQGLTVHAWINPMRLMLTGEMAAVPDRYLIKQWYKAGGDRVVEVDGRLYLNPAYPEARQLIADGAAEILKKYNVAGIHIDDYFYPTKDASFDKISFAKSGYASLQAFRENNINQMVSLLYQTVHKTKKDAVFGVSPAGNLDSLRSTYFIDVQKWCSEDGYIDYIIPQLYYGFLHDVCPFDKMVDKWEAIITNPKVKYYVGLSGGNAYNAYSGGISVWAVTEAGKYEWINHKDVLKRSFEYIFNKDSVDGYCFFCYQYLYSPTTGSPTPALAAEYANFIDLVR